MVIKKGSGNVEHRLNEKQLYREDEHHLVCGLCIVLASDATCRSPSTLFELPVSCLSCKLLVL